MESLLNQFLGEFFFTFFMIFVRFGTALMIMPGIGDTFINARVRLLFALALTLIVTPSLAGNLPPAPPIGYMFILFVMKEAIIGFFIGLIGRILMTILSIAGMTISMQSGLASAMVFNPTMSGQGSIIGSFLSLLGVVLLFATNLHHILILTIYNSYDLFQFATINEIGDMTGVISNLLNDVFRIGVQFAAPFIIISLMMYLALGVLARLMPQLQVFFIALPLQILVGFMVLSIILSIGMTYWLTEVRGILTDIFAQ